MYGLYILIACVVIVIAILCYQRFAVCLQGTWYVPFQFAKTYGLYSYVVKFADRGTAHILIVNKNKSNMISETVQYQTSGNTIAIRSGHPYIKKMFGNSLRYEISKKNNAQFLTLYNGTQVVGNFIKT